MRGGEKVLGLLAVCLMTAGVFLPIASVSLTGEISFWGIRGSGDGKFNILLAGLVLAGLLAGSRRLVLGAAVASLALLAFKAVSLAERLPDSAASLSGNLLARGQPVTWSMLHWGWLPLVLGAVLALSLGLRRR